MKKFCFTIKNNLKFIYGHALNYTNNIWYNSILSGNYSYNNNSNNSNSDYYIYDTPHINIEYNNDDVHDDDFVYIADDDHDNHDHSRNMSSSIHIE